MCKCVLETMSSKVREHAQAHVAPFSMFLSLVLALHATARAPNASWGTPRPTVCARTSTDVGERYKNGIRSGCLCERVLETADPWASGATKRSDAVKLVHWLPPFPPFLRQFTYPSLRIKLR